MSRIELAMLGILAVAVAVALALGLIWLTGPDDSANNQAAQTSVKAPTSPPPAASATEKNETPTPEESQLAARPELQTPAPAPPAEQQPEQFQPPLPTPNAPQPGSAPFEEPAAPADDPDPLEYDDWPELSCPAGQATLILEDVNVIAEGDSEATRMVEVSGHLTNDTVAAVEAYLWNSVAVIGIDRDGERAAEFRPEYKYKTAPGELRPFHISLKPGATLQFDSPYDVYSDEWESITHWMLDPISTDPTLQFTEDSFCDAPVMLTGEPVPAGSHLP
ncbi:hypothetical protein [Arthrobacter sp. VKM Ac-2550]|uniref:hypothetical protein n=1 Tax=Crystallibacter permensis TaxID=1938888 RepID=UPI0022264461|nr:hypothetical protein [Arthrobacter sp. VKM Ac-2550]MCW2131703.1 hypothetical protein [Arthrobacter sp. VKM Ac-2550]